MFNNVESYLSFVKKLVPPEIVENEALLKDKLKQGYDTLPYPVRLSISEESFISFWVKNKNSILLAVTLRK